MVDCKHFIEIYSATKVKIYSLIDKLLAVSASNNSKWKGVHSVNASHPNASIGLPTLNEGKPGEMIYIETLGA